MDDRAGPGRAVAIVPVKRFELAKQRLGTTLAPEQRWLLARAMVADVIAALRATPGLRTTLVVTREASVTALAASAGAEVVRDRYEEGQSAAAAQGIRRATALQATRVLLVPGDCPALDPSEVQALLDGPTEHDRASVVVVPDRHGTGTNALLLTPPDALVPSFGPDSFERHRLGAEIAGVGLRVARPASLLLDIDTGDDLEALRARLACTAGLAVHTRAALEGL